MVTDARDRTFGMDGPSDLFDKLMWESEQVRRLLAVGNNDGVIDSVYFSLNAATTAWHIADWVIEDLTERQAWPITVDGANIEGAGALRNYALTNPYMKVVHQIGNAWKHRSLQKRTYLPDYSSHNEEVHFVSSEEPSSLRFLGVNVPNLDDFHVRDDYGRIVCQFHGPLDVRIIFDGAVEWWGGVLRQLSYIP